MKLSTHNIHTRLHYLRSYIVDKYEAFYIDNLLAQCEIRSGLQVSLILSQSSVRFLNELCVKYEIPCDDKSIDNYVSANSRNIINNATYGTIIQPR